MRNTVLRIFRYLKRKKGVDHEVSLMINVKGIHLRKNKLQEGESGNKIYDSSESEDDKLILKKLLNEW